MKITKDQLRKIISEARPDGTISGEEDNERDLLMAEVEETIEDLVRLIQTEAERIGGGFRGPGIKRQALDLAAELLHGYR